jgi:chromosomal replication initiation ATPase DnaA
MYMDDGTYRIGLNPKFVAMVRKKRRDDARKERQRRKDERDRARLARQESMTVPVSEIINRIARKHRIKPTDITSRDKSLAVRSARLEAIQTVYRDMPDLTISVMASNFGLHRGTITRYLRSAPLKLENEIPVLHSGMPAGKIAILVAKYHGFGCDDIYGDRRDSKVVKARYDALMCIRKLKPDLSAGYLGKMFNRCHTTILYALGTLTSKSKKRLGHHPVYESLSE